MTKDVYVPPFTEVVVICYQSSVMAASPGIVISDKGDGTQKRDSTTIDHGGDSGYDPDLSKPYPGGWGRVGYGDGTELPSWGD